MTKEKKLLKLTKKQIEKVQKFEIKKDSGETFMHCAHCSKEYHEGKFGKNKSPKEAMTYSVGEITIPYDKGKKLGVVVVYCNRCGRSVWDTRHLTHLY